MSLRIIKNDPMFETRLNAELRKLRERVSELESERSNYLKSIPPASIGSDHIRNRSLKLDSEVFRDESLPTAKIAPEAVTFEKLGKGSIRDDVVLPDRGLTRFDSFGPFNVNVPNGNFESLIKTSSELRPNFWDIKDKGIYQWLKDVEIVQNNSSLIGCGATGIRLKGSGVKTVQSDFIPIPESRLIQAYVRWQADSATASDNFTLRFRYYEKDKVTEISGIVAVSKQASAANTDQVDRSTLKSPANARWLRVELEKATANFALTIARVDLKEVPITFRVGRSSNETVSFGTSWKVPNWNSTVYDPFSAFSLASDYMQVPTGWDGQWEFSGAITHDQVKANGEVIVATLVNRAPAYTGYVVLAKSHSDYMDVANQIITSPVVSGSVELNSGDRVTSAIYSVNDSSYTIIGEAARTSTWFSGRFLH